MAANYYWIGGSGNWSDINHWATTSGGSTLHSVVPSPSDNTFFDAGSGFTASGKQVTLDVTANCHHMAWNGASNNPILSGGANSLNIFGSMTLQAGMSYLIISTYFKSSALGETITLNGTSIGGSVYFNGTGEWVLQDNYTSIGYIYPMQGSLNTNNKTVNIYTLWTNMAINTPTTFSLTLGTSLININATSSGGWYYTGTGAFLNAGTSHIVFTNASSANLRMAGQAGHTYYNVTAYATMDGNEGIGFGSSYHRVRLYNNTTIRSGNRFDSLILGAGKKINFQGIATQTITAALTATSTPCAGLTELNSLTPGTQANILFLTGASCNISNALIQDLKANGFGIPVTAAGCFDLGNNANINVTTAGSNNLYWVGASGAWNDPSHWAFTSGGAGGACIPTPADNVFFDANSGFTPSNRTVSLTGIGQYCHHILWSGAANTPVISGGAINPLNIYGSMTLQSGMTYQINSTHFRSPSLGETISTNSTVINGNVYYNGAGGWTFQDNYSSTGYVYPIQGNLNTNNKTLSIYSLWANNSINTSAPFSLTLGSSIININTTSAAGWYYTGAGASLNAGTSHIIFTNTSATNIRMAGQAGHTYYNVTAYGSLDTYEGIGFGAAFHRVRLYNNTFIKGSNTFDSLLLAGGKKFNFQGAATQTITAALTATSIACNGLTELNSLTPGSQANLHFLPGASASISNALIQDIKANGSGIPLVATGSFNLGNTTNITFMGGSGNNLYWVGASGSWNDAAHWSFSSGGAGGACIPTPADNVFFDSNSGFILSSNTVSLTGVGQYCHNMNWNGAQNTPTITGSAINPLSIYGSIGLQNGMAYLVLVTHFKSPSMGETITTNGTTIVGSVYFNGTGTWTLQDNYTSNGSIYPMQGVLNTNHQTVSIYSFLTNVPIQMPTTFSLLLGRSTININTANSGGWQYEGTGTSLNAGTSHIIFTNSSAINVRMSGQAGHSYYNVTSFANMDAGAGIGFGSSYHRVYLYNNAIIKGNNKFDTLLLSAGKTYYLQAASTQTISQQLYTSGNPCFILFLRSTIPGTQAAMHVVGGNTAYDFVDTKDIHASGLPFNAAGHSTNSGNNLNWTFAPATTLGLEGLGADQQIGCNGFPVTLNTTGFYPNPNTSFIWYNASTLGTAIVADSGRYFISVNYGSGCVIRDTITLSKPATIPVTTSASSTVICNGSSAILSAGGVTSYIWSMGAVSPSVSVSPSASIIYSVTGIDLNHCASTGTIGITVNPSPTVSIAAVSNNSFCPGNNAVINATGLSSYTLQPGNITGSSFTVSPSSTSTYTINGTNSLGCASNTTTEAHVTITVHPTPSISISSTTNNTLCAGATMTLTAGGATTYTLMPDNLTGSSFTLNPLSTTIYTISGTSSAGCISSPGSIATTTITVTPTQSISIAAISNTNICSGNSVTITLNGAVSYNLIPGNITGNSFTLSPSATTNYTITGTLAPGCLSNQANTLNTNITVFPVPVLSPVTGNSISCFGGTTNVTAHASGGTSPYSYHWGNNSSTSNIAGYAAGTYTVALSDANLCKSASQTISVTQPSVGLTVYELSRTAACSNEANGELHISISGGTPAYSVLWSNGATETNLNYLAAGILEATITDANGCVYQHQTTIAEKSCMTAVIPQLFTPNGDGKNDTFTIEDIHNYPNNSFNVFNRWGSPVYSKNNYQNEWDGKPNVGDAAGNGLLPSGTYFIIVDFGTDSQKPYKGYVELKY